MARVFTLGLSLTELLTFDLFCASWQNEYGLHRFPTIQESAHCPMKKGKPVSRFPLAYLPSTSYFGYLIVSRLPFPPFLPPYGLEGLLITSVMGLASISSWVNTKPSLYPSPHSTVFAEVTKICAALAGHLNQDDSSEWQRPIFGNVGNYVE